MSTVIDDYPHDDSDACLCDDDDGCNAASYNNCGDDDSCDGASSLAAGAAAILLTSALASLLSMA